MADIKMPLDKAFGPDGKITETAKVLLIGAVRAELRAQLDSLVKDNCVEGGSVTCEGRIWFTT